MDETLVALLACPKDLRPLAHSAAGRVCEAGHEYPVIHGVPILVRDDVAHPHWAGDLAVGLQRDARVPDAWLAELPRDPGVVDAYVQAAVGATNGNLYRHLIGRLPRYPVPTFPLAPRGHARLLDIGCSWGRWSIAAARAGYEVIGMDPLPEAVFTARRVARQLGVPARFVVGDARHLPFRAGVVDQAFSFSVLQHLDDEAIASCALGLRRVLAAGGGSLLQFASRHGLLSMARLAGRGLRRARHFEVRYRDPAALVRLFGETVGPTTVVPEGFFSLNARRDDLDLMTPAGACLVRLSAALCAASARVPGLGRLADSVWVRSTRAGDASSG
ncbi:MAG: methyltransferase domain-containing protein [Vicinamibacterales bacterium]